MSFASGVLLPGGVAAVVAWQLCRLLHTTGEVGVRGRELSGALACALALTAGLTATPLPGELVWQLRVIELAAIGVLLAGLWREQGRGRPYQAGLAIVLAALLVVWLTPLRVATVKIPLLADRFADLGLLAPLVTVVWIAGLAVLVRSTDPQPGLTAGLGTLAAATFLLVALTRGRDPLAAVSPLTLPLGAALGGACLGLLSTGLGPQAVTLGRGGAGMVGFLLGVLALVGTLKHTAFLLVALPVLALAVPVLNAVYMRRQYRRAGQQDPALLDRARTLGDMLARRGFEHQRSTALLLALQAYCCLVALALVGLITVPFVLKALLLALLLPLALAVFFLLSRIAAKVAVVGGGRVEILGVPIDAVTYDEALARIDGFIASGQPHHVFTADVSGIMKAGEEPELLEIVRTCDLVTADGAGVLWAARLFDLPVPERVSGVDLVRRLASLAASQGYRPYLLGAAPGVAATAADILQRENPGLQIAGLQDGYFQDEAAVVAAIQAAAPQVLYVALGIPKQEQFIRRWYRELGVPVCLGIGGSFDVISGKLERAPVWMQRAGLEWLFRVWQEPKRLPRLLALPRFVLAIARESWRKWRQAPPAE
ncbi:MAG: WecB/TagA/CpsF family glycosyltransferase [Fimbriimonadaceae bacterium]|nr:WecB/TagA/CpsF family glycosyltransferase [Fimbriimonadaceae bacterium]